MEVMDISLDKFYKFIYSVMISTMPEEILGKIAVAVSTMPLHVLLVVFLVFIFLP